MSLGSLLAKYDGDALGLVELGAIGLAVAAVAAGLFFAIRSYRTL